MIQYFILCTYMYVVANNYCDTKKDLTMNKNRIENCRVILCKIMKLFFHKAL